MRDEALGGRDCIVADAKVLTALVLRHVDSRDKGDRVGLEQVDLGAPHAANVVGVAVCAARRCGGGMERGVSD